MLEVDWQTIKEEDLKDKEQLVKAFRKFLRKECKYSAEEAKFSADVIEEPFARNFNSAKRKFEITIMINDRTYEVFSCFCQDSADEAFEFYTLVDVATKGEAHYGDELLPYIFAKKKFVLPDKYAGGNAK